jgi:hypothetical protein
MPDVRVVGIITSPRAKPLVSLVDVMGFDHLGSIALMSLNGT